MEEPKIKKRRHLPPFVKAALIKYWFAGAVYFFVGWGLFLYSSDQLDLVFALGVVGGAVTDLLVNRIFTFMESSRREYHPYMMCCGKRVYSFWVNILYALLLSACVAYTYHFINVFAIRARNLSPATVVLGAEPLLYGLFYLVYDLIFLGARNGIARIGKRSDHHAVT